MSGSSNTPIAIVVLLVFSFTNVCTRTFSRCQLAKELEKHGFSQEELPTWVCLIESESGRNTSARGGPNKNGSYDHGLFQINDRWWCNTGDKPGKDCNVKCDELEEDDITISVKCAKLIYKKQGLKAWNGWKKRCKDQPLPDLSKCFNSTEED